MAHQSCPARAQVPGITVQDDFAAGDQLEAGAERGGSPAASSGDDAVDGMEEGIALAPLPPLRAHLYTANGVIQKFLAHLASERFWEMQLATAWEEGASCDSNYAIEWREHKVPLIPA